MSNARLPVGRMPITKGSSNVHSLGVGDNELAGTQETQERQSVQSLSVALLLELRAELDDLRILLRGGVARVTSVGFRSGSGEGVLIVLGIKRQLVLSSGCHGE